MTLYYFSEHSVWRWSIGFAFKLQNFRNALKCLETSWNVRRKHVFGTLLCISNVSTWHGLRLSSNRSEIGCPVLEIWPQELKNLQNSKLYWFFKKFKNEFEKNQNFCFCMNYPIFLFFENHHFVQFEIFEKYGLQMQFFLCW